jgi:hypothetical protein
MAHLNVLLIDHIDVLFVDYGDVLLVGILLISHWLDCLFVHMLMVFVDDINMVLHNHILMMLMDNVLVDFPNYFLRYHFLLLLLLDSSIFNSDINNFLDVLPGYKIGLLCILLAHI